MSAPAIFPPDGRSTLKHEIEQTAIDSTADTITRRRWRLASDLLADPTLLAPPVVEIPYLAWVERTTLLAGREKFAGKTTYAATAAAKKSRGGIHLGVPVSQGRVMWTMAEGHVGDVLRVLYEAGGDMDQIAVHNDLGVERLAILEAQIADFNPTTVFIDTLASFTDDRINDAHASAGWTPIMNELGKIAQRQHVAIVIIAHARKSDGAVRDSTAITAGVDMILSMDTVSDCPTARHIKALGRWSLADHTIRLDDQQYHMVLGGEISPEIKMLDFIRAKPGCSKTKIRQAMGGNASKADKTLIELMERGFVINDGDSNGGSYRVPNFGSSAMSRTGVRTGVLENANSLQDMTQTGFRPPHPVPDPNPLGSGDRGRQESLL